MQYGKTGVLGFILCTAVAYPAAAAEQVTPELTPPSEAPKSDEAVATQKPDEEAHPRAKNSVYAEGLGAGLVYSINYERLVLEDLSVRAGFSYMSVSVSAGSSSASSKLMTFPITASYLGVGSKHHILELGGGATVVSASGSANSLGYSASSSGMGVLPDLLVGYRLHPIDGAGFNFRVGLMAFFGKGVGFSDTPDEFGVLPWGYLSMGASFL